MHLCLGDMMRQLKEVAVQTGSPPAAKYLGNKAKASGMRNPWSDERARFLSVLREESEERIERVFLAGENERGFEATGLSLDGEEP
jgi:hypothetical protein